MTDLLNSLLLQIKQTGPITVADYMNICLLHPKHGYYSKQDPFGKKGDFITSPEISQVFGELLGLCLAQNWIDQGMEPFSLVEAGPGRGTLMADILRATKSVPDFHKNMSIHLIEESPALKKIQRETLSNFCVQWHKSFNHLPKKQIYFIANEFFDALPIRQFKKTKTGWSEILVSQQENKLIFCLGNKIPLTAIPHRIKDTNLGDIIEICAAAKPIMKFLSGQIMNYGGCAIIIDYGANNLKGNTLQSVKNHNKINTLKLPGNSDLTAHVDFTELTKDLSNILVTKTTRQGTLLKRLGIINRMEKLTSNLKENQKIDYKAAAQRLIEPNEMGALFKAIALYPSKLTAPAGFDL